MPHFCSVLARFLDPEKPPWVPPSSSSSSSSSPTPLISSTAAVAAASSSVAGQGSSGDASPLMRITRSALACVCGGGAGEGLGLVCLVGESVWINKNAFKPHPRTCIDKVCILYQLSCETLIDIAMQSATSFTMWQLKRHSFEPTLKVFLLFSRQGLNFARLAGVAHLWRTWDAAWLTQVQATAHPPEGPAQVKINWLHLAGQLWSRRWGRGNLFWDFSFSVNFQRSFGLVCRFQGWSFVG